MEAELHTSRKLRAVRARDAAGQPPASPPARSDQVQSLVRALAIVNRLAGADDGIGLTELAQQVHLSPSTAHRLLTTLEQERYVHFDAERRLWSVGVQAFVAGSAFLKTRSLAGTARPHMRALMELTEETVNLAVEDRLEAVYLSQVECRQMMRAFARPGGRVPLHCSSVGKALLSALPDSEVRRILNRRGLPQVTAKTLHTKASLRTDLGAARQRGYAIDNEEHAVGLRCVAAVVFDENAEAVAAVSVSGPMARISDDRIPLLGHSVRATADAITGQLEARCRRGGRDFSRLELRQERRRQHAGKAAQQNMGLKRSCDYQVAAVAPERALSSTFRIFGGSRNRFCLCVVPCKG